MHSLREIVLYQGNMSCITMKMRVTMIVKIILLISGGSGDL